MKDQTFTESDIHYFTDSKGRKWAHMSWGMITGDIPDNVIYPTDWGKIVFVDNISSHWNTYPTADEEPFAVIPADRIEVVTEHVEATVMDALDALRDNVGKPVEGWEFDNDPSDGVRSVGTIRGVDAKEKTFHPLVAGIGYYYEWYRFAYRPVTRVRIKGEVKPEPKFKVGDLVESTKYAYNGRVNRAYENYHYEITNAIRGDYWYSDERDLRTWAPGYGFTLDGNPVPPPPEGWEIVPEGEATGEDAKFYHDGTGNWFESVVGKDHTATLFDEVRAYARRVAKKSPTAETVEQGFSKYWHDGSEHRAIDAFRAGAAWAKEVQGE